jgi:hypothetical protein
MQMLTSRMERERSERQKRENSSVLWAEEEAQPTEHSHIGKSRFLQSLEVKRNGCLSVSTARGKLDAGLGPTTYWQFTFIFQSTRTTSRTTEQWSDEPEAPNTSNLSKHTRESHPDQRKAYNEAVTAQKQLGPSSDNIDVGEGVINLQPVHGSAETMMGWLAKAKDNPAWPKTQRSFYEIVTAWFISDNLPWTTGETEWIDRVFTFADCRYTLPSDTTVRKYVKIIYERLHGQVVRELTVSRFSVHTPAPS